MEERIYLRKARLKGYKSIKDTEATFLPGINVIIGDNGSGKTNFLEALYEGLDNFAIKPIDKTLTYLEIDKVKEDGSMVNYSWRITVEKVLLNDLKTDRKALSYYDFYKVDASFLLQSKKMQVKETYTTFDSFILDIRFKASELIEGRKGFFIVGGIGVVKYGVREPFGSNLFPSSIKFVDKGKVSLPADNFDNELGLNAAFYGAVINTLNTQEGMKDTPNGIRNYFGSFVNRNFKSALDTYTSIREVRLSESLFVRKEGVETIIDNIQIEYLLDERWHKWHELSDGTKRLLLIITNALAKQEGIVLVEEPELGLYPSQLEKLLDFFKEYQDRYQFIITTHSPQVLDVLTIKELDRINVAEMTSEGTKIKKLSPAKKKAAKAFYENTGLMSDYWRFDNLGLKQ